MPDERWQDIHAKRWALALPPVPPLAPSARTDRPICPAHCSGRHAVEGTIGCGDCGGVAYHVVAHEWRGCDGHWFYEMRAAAGAPAYDPARVLRCCGTAMRRR